MVFNAIGWPSLNTSVATCIVAALSSVGSSRQKQILRISGAAVGGFIFGIGSQVCLLPYVDSIFGFTLFFAAVTGIAAWFSTTSARVSYFGLQMALAFFLINMQEPAFQTSLAIARDRVMGILLGLLAMWIVFDLLGGVRAADQMLLQLRRSIRLMAELQELSFAPEAAHIARRMESIREELISNFAAVNTEADAVLLETGAERGEHLALRERALSIQPWLRSLLLLQVSALQYRRERPIHELPLPIAEAQRSFDEAVALQLRRLATNLRLERAESVQSAFHALRHEIDKYYRQGSGGTVSTTASAILSLSESIASTLDPADGHLALPAR